MIEYIPLILSAIAIIFSVLIPIIHNHNKYHWDEDKIRDKVVKSIKESERVERIIIDKVQSRLANKDQPKISTLSKDEVVEEVLERLKPEIYKMVSEALHQVSQQTESVGAKEESKPNRKRYGFYGKDSFVLTDTPTDTTVYCFMTDPKNNSKVWFDVHDVQKVTQDKNLLLDCCTIEGEGSRLLTLEKGLAVCKDGKWMLEKKLKLKFS
ncbi:MAG: hypothetical protein IKX38_01505 [Bacteroidales bacterium]|nr:hypothetical protein [Bacteroidales bacterium]